MLSLGEAMNHFSGHTTMDMDRESLPWGVFIFLFIVFYFATWYDLSYTVRDPNTVQEITVLVDKGLLGRRIGLFCLGGVGLFNLIYSIISCISSKIINRYFS